MNVDWIPFLHRGLLIIIGLVGFQGLWSQSSVLKKVLAWMIFQSALILLWYSTLEPNGASSLFSPPDKRSITLNPLSHSILFASVLVWVIVLLALMVFVLGIYRHYGTLQIEEMDKGKRE